MATVIAQRVSLAFGDHLVLDRVDLSITEGDRLGIVAPNGVGKSTLLRVLAGEVKPDEGSVSRSPGATVVRLAQEPDIRSGETLLEFFARQTGILAAAEAMQHAAERLAGVDQRVADDYASALEGWLALGGADVDSRAKAIATELQLDFDLSSRDARDLSGGQQARLMLAAVLLAQPDILLLDEPSNNLDDDGLMRLETHVRNSRAGIALVSHDRAFLSATINRVAELDEFTHRIAEYKGGWDSYLQERELVRQHARRDYGQYQAKRAKLVETAQRQRQWAQAGTARAASQNRQPDGDKNRRASRLAGAQATAAKAAQTRKSIERLDEQAPADIRDPWHLQLNLAQTRRSGDIVVSLRGAVVRCGDFTLGPVNLTIGWAERVRIIGPNGSGKTTLVNALTGRIPLNAGNRYCGPGVIFGELDQARALFSATEPLAEVIRSSAGLDLGAARTLLAKFRLSGDKALRPTTALSPGERTRASLALLQARGTNCLVLDEPTNHLDLEAIEQLEQALDGYDGTLILVTHDRRHAEGIRLDRFIDCRDL